MVESSLAFGGRVSEDGVAQSITLVHWLSPLCPAVPYLIYPGLSSSRCGGWMTAQTDRRTDGGAKLAARLFLFFTRGKVGFKYLGRFLSVDSFGWAASTE
ncbi:hypothetical protein K0M31_012175 [Melipona bicolor]|uniref:Uncharacterized protein n=1 Tax=Melipona bicolor TaxID=60889 RepID=A0AA40FKM6_9HYME|nr:hypothetical protein K0M31_012175 [Melipona bicolor]